MSDQPERKFMAWAGGHTRLLVLVLVIGVVLSGLEDLDLTEVACRDEQGDEHLRGVEGRRACSPVDGV